MKKSAKLITLLLFGIFLNLNSALHAEKLKDVEFNIYNSSTSIAASDIANALSGYTEGCTLDFTFISDDEFEITNVSCTSDDGTNINQIENVDFHSSVSKYESDAEQREWFEGTTMGLIRMARYMLILKGQGISEFEITIRGGMYVLTYWV